MENINSNLLKLTGATELPSGIDTEAISDEIGLVNFEDFYEDLFKLMRFDEEIKDLMLKKMNLEKY